MQYFYFGCTFYSTKKKRMSKNLHFFNFLLLIFFFPFVLSLDISFFFYLSFFVSLSAMQCPFRCRQNVSFYCWYFLCNVHLTSRMRNSAKCSWTFVYNMHSQLWEMGASGCQKKFYYNWMKLCIDIIQFFFICRNYLLGIIRVNEMWVCVFLVIPICIKKYCIFRERKYSLWWFKKDLEWFY